MAEDRDLIIGEVREAVRAIRDHLKRQDDTQLVRDQQTEINKREAIKAREEKDLRDEARFRVLDEKTTLTGGRVSLLEKLFEEDVKPVVDWHHHEGSKLGGRVSLLEQARIADDTEKKQAAEKRAGEEGERRGSLRAFALVWSLVTAVGAAIITYGKDIIGFFTGAIPPAGH